MFVGTLGGPGPELVDELPAATDPLEILDIRFLVSDSAELRCVESHRCILAEEEDSWELLRYGCIAGVQDEIGASVND